MSKFAWYFVGGTLFLMFIGSFWTAMSLGCYPYNDYSFYLYCKHFRNGQMIKSIIYFISSMWCFSR